MTDTITITGVRVGPVEANILALYGAQDDHSADTIAAKTGEKPATVLRLLGTLPGGGRAAAARIAVTWMVRVGWGPTTAAVTEPAEPDGISALLSRAIATDRPSMIAAADQIADLADALEKRLVEHDMTAGVRAEIGRLEAQIAELRAHLPEERSFRGSTSAIPGRDQQIRQWAAENNVRCPRTGRVPRDVRAAYERAMAGGPVTATPKTGGPA